VLEILEEARQIQLSILPRTLPRPGEYELAARSVAAELVGGDFYDVITLDEATFAVAVADATGHGLPAALQVRDVFMGLRMGLSREFKLTRTIGRLNRIIHHSRLATKFVSLFLAEVNTGGHVIYCNAGHPPALLLHSDGSVSRLATGGPLLGPKEKANYVVDIVTMAPGDLLVLYTDGVVEARDLDSDEEYGEPRLLTVLRTLRHSDPTVIVDRVLGDVADFTHTSPPRDDQTVLVVRRCLPEDEPGVA
jgi:sigma-B regulation protein RsbU (phosphoserine phosphatase)